MSADIADLLYRSLPGVYRDWDEDEQLRRFLEVAAQPLVELEASIDQLRVDVYVDTCRTALIPLVGALVGVQVDATLPALAQREQVRDAIRRYRAKGTADQLLRFASALTGWHVQLVDFSGHVGLLPHVESLLPLERRRDQPVTDHPPGSGNYSFTSDLDAVDPPTTALFDALSGRVITRSALAGDEVRYAGVEGRFTITAADLDLFRGDERWSAVAADLSDFASPRTPGGGPLVLGARQVAVDPALGRFRLGPGPPPAGQLRVTYQRLAPGLVPTQTCSVAGDMSTRLGRSDDTTPRTLDLRAPRRAADAIGRAHFDNLGFFLTPARVVVDRTPTHLGPTPADFDLYAFRDASPVPGDLDDVVLQLLDGLDGAPLTRDRLDGDELSFCGASRGFAIRLNGADIADPAFEPRVRIRAADLRDPNTPRRPDGGSLVLASTDVAVDPQLGRFLLDLSGLVTGAGDPADATVRVDYLLAPAVRVEGAAVTSPPGAAPEVRSLRDGEPVEVVDAFSGTAIGVALRLGTSLAVYDGTPRGWTVRRNGQPVNADLPALIADLSDVTATGGSTPAGRLALDPERGILRFPVGELGPTDEVTVDYAHPDRIGQARRIDTLAQQLPQAVPAGVVPVLVDTRGRPPDPAGLGWPP